MFVVKCLHYIVVDNQRCSNCTIGKKNPVAVSYTTHGIPIQHIVSMAILENIDNFVCFI